MHGKIIGIVLLIVSVCFGATTSVRIYQQVGNASSYQNKQLGIDTVPDAALGWRMWSGKDAVGGVTKWLAKDKPARVDSLESTTGARMNRLYIDSVRTLNHFSTITGDSIRATAINGTRVYSGITKSDTSRAYKDTAYIAVFDSARVTKLSAGTITGATKLTIDTAVVLKQLVFPDRWDDMDQFNLFAAKTVGATGFPPTVATGNGFSQLQIGISDSAQGLIEHGHKFIEGDTAHFHVHYLTAAKDANDRYVNWSIHYLFRNINDTITYMNTITKQDTIAANTPALTHKFLEIGEVPTPLIKIGAQCVIMFKRIAASPTTNPSASPYILQVGIHRKINSIGSRTESTK